MKRVFFIFVAALILFVAVPVALASATVSVDKTTVLPGETVTISGTAGADENVVIKITDEAGNIVFFDGASADSSGNYSAKFVVPSDMSAGSLTVTAGSGSDVATTTINVSSPPATPTPTSAASPTPTNTASPTSSATPTSSASVSPSEATDASASPSEAADTSASPSASASSNDEPAQSDANNPTASQSGKEDGAITPKEISQDEETGIITIGIDVNDLPEGTIAVEAPNGDILYVSDAKDGVLVIEVTEDDVDINGDIEIVALDDELTPLASVKVKVLDENDELVIAKTDDTGSNAWIIFVCVVVGVIILATIAWVLLKKKNQNA